MEKNVDMYTRQHENSIFEIINKGFMTNKEIYVRLHMNRDAEYFISAYRHFVKLASNILPRPEGTEFPIWASISKNNCLKPEYNSIVYFLKVPVDQVIYLDGMKWDYVLNHLYIPENHQDKIAYEKELNQLGIHSEYQIFTKYNKQFPHLEEKIKDSWSRVFEIESMNEFIVQANLWSIKKEWIQRVVHPGDDFFTENWESLDLSEDAKKIKDRQSLRFEEKNKL